MSSTGRGFSQSECYRTLVQVEGLVNDGHHCSPEECAQLGQRLAQILDGSRSNVLSVNEIKTIRRITRPFTRANPLLKRNSNRTTRSNNRRRAADEEPPATEESAFVALPPIASATKRETPSSESQAPPNSQRVVSRQASALAIPARKPRKRSEWDSVVLKKDEEDLRKIEAERQQQRLKKQEYRDEVIAQRAELEEQRFMAKQRTKEDNEVVAAKVSEYRAAEEAEAQRRKKKADQLRQWNEEGLAQRQKILDQVRFVRINQTYSGLTRGLKARALCPLSHCARRCAGLPAGGSRDKEDRGDAG